MFRVSFATDEEWQTYQLAQSKYAEWKGAHLAGTALAVAIMEDWMRLRGADHKDKDPYEQVAE